MGQWESTEVKGYKGLAVRACKSAIGGLLLVGVSGDGKVSKWSDKVKRKEVADKVKAVVRGRRKKDLQRRG